jgi:hypothetical protein
MVTSRRESQPRRRWRGKKRTPERQSPRASDLCVRVVDLVLIRRSAAPRRGVQSPPEQELLGAMTSLGPSRECYKPSRKSRGRPAKTADAPTTASTVPAQRMRAPLSAETGAAALLQRAVPEGGAGLVAEEGAGELPGHGGRQTEAQRAEPTLPGARQEPKTSGRGSRSRGREGNH